MDLNRKQFLHQLAVVTGTAAVWPSSLLTAQETAGLREMIQLIGNANNEIQRAELLAQSLLIPGISDEEKDILNKLFNVSDRWANGFTKYANPGSEGNESSGYLCSFL